MHIEAITRYPVKSLPGEALTRTPLKVGRGIPGDRHWALARADGSAGADGAWVEKGQFHVLVRHPEMAAIPLPADPGDAASGRALETALAEQLGLAAGAMPAIRAAAGPGYFDTLKGEVSFLNLASVAALADRAGQDIDPVRFRANFWLGGCDPWAEDDWVGKTAVLGSAEIRFSQITGRCAATHVNPQTATSDINILKLLKQHFAHTNMGIYAMVTAPGHVQPGDQIKFKK